MPSSAYDRDPRVKPHGHGFHVTAPDGEAFFILPDKVYGGWTIYHDTLQMPMLVIGRRPAFGFPTAELAIGTLIGPPRR